MYDLLSSSCLLTPYTFRPEILVWPSYSVSYPIFRPEAVVVLSPSLLTVIPDAVVCEDISNEFQIYFETHFFLLETLLDRNTLTAHFPVKPNSRSEF